MSLNWKFTIAFTLFVSQVYGQKWSWFTGGGARYDQYITAATLDKHGNTYAVGYVNDSLHIDNNTLLYRGLFLLKLDTAGKVVYSKGFGSGNHTQGTGIEYDTAGYLYISGEYTNGKIDFGTVSITNPVRNQVRPFLVKTDLEGKGIWGVNINTGISSTVHQLSYGAKDSLVVVSGRVYGTNDIYFGQDTFNGRGSYDLYVAAFNSVTGKFLWADLGGGKHWDSSSGLDIDKDGNTYISLTFQHINNPDTFFSKQLSIPCTDDYDAALVKYDKHGKVTWFKELRGRWDQIVQTLKVGKDNRIYMTASVTYLDSSFIIDSKHKPTNRDHIQIILKVDSSGKLLKIKPVNTYGSGRSTEMDQDSAGNLYIVGANNYVFDDVKVRHNSQSNFFVAKMDTALYGIAGVRSGNSELGFRYRIKVDKNGDCLVYGSVELKSGKKLNVASWNYTSKGDAEIFLAKWNFNDTCYLSNSSFGYTRSGKTFFFTDSSTGNIDKRLWLFGDGTTDTSKSPAHTFAKPGRYDVQLITENQCGKDTATDSLFIDCLAKANFGFKITGRNVQFYDSSTAYNHLYWTFDDGSTDTLTNPLHRFNANGTYKVKLVAVGACTSDSITLDVVINCDLPESDFDLRDTNLNVHFINLSKRADSYQWLYGDGAEDTSSTPTHLYSKTGDYTVILIATNICGADTLQKNVTLSCPKPEIDFDFTIKKDSVLFVAKTKSLQVEQLHFDFDDGSTSMKDSVMHIYTSEDRFLVTLTAENRCGKDTVQKVVDLRCFKPEIDLSYKVNRDSVTFTATSSIAVNRWSYDFGDGSNSDSAETTHVYLAEGRYSVTVIAENGCGYDTLIKEVEIQCRPEADFGFTTTIDEVSFLNQSKYSLSQIWKFGDGTSDTSFNSYHQYRDTGSFEVTLTAINQCGSDTVIKTIYIGCIRPQISFISEYKNGATKFTVTDSFENVHKWLWDFGDGNASSVKNPTHDYTQSGTYEVVLIGTNSCGADTFKRKELLRSSSVALIWSEVNSFWYNSENQSLQIEPNNRVFQVYIYDSKGSKVMDVKKARGGVDLAELPIGVYNVIVLSRLNGQYLSGKILVN